RTSDEIREHGKLARPRPLHVHIPRPRGGGANLSPPPPLHRRPNRVPVLSRHRLRSRKRDLDKPPETTQIRPHVVNHSTSSGSNKRRPRLLKRIPHSVHHGTPIHLQVNSIPNSGQQRPVLNGESHRTVLRHGLSMSLICASLRRVKNRFRLARKVDSRHARLHQPALIENAALSEPDMHVVVVVPLRRPGRVGHVAAAPPLPRPGG